MNKAAKLNTIISLTLLSTFLHNCSQTKKTGTNQLESSYTQTSIAQEASAMQKTGIDFFAEGNDPAIWKLQMSYDDTVQFVAADGLAIKFAFNQLKKDITTERSIFSTTLKNANISIAVYNKVCTIAAQKEVFKKEVTFSFNSITYKGCGKFLANDKLNGKWILEKIAGTNINPNDYKRNPYFVIDLLKETVSGNDGCNGLDGTIEVQGKRIQFSNIRSTKMACNNKSIANIISQKISNQLVDYYFKEGKLYLYLPDDSLLVFVKS